MSRTAFVTSLVFVTIRPSGQSSSADAFFSFPRYVCVGERVTVYVLPSHRNSSVTSVGVSSSAYFERSMSDLRLSPLGSPYRA